MMLSVLYKVLSGNDNGIERIGRHKIDQRPWIFVTAVLLNDQKDDHGERLIHQQQYDPAETIPAKRRPSIFLNALGAFAPQQ